MYVTPEDKVRNFIDEGVVFYVSLTNLKSQIGKNERFSIHHYAVEERWSICRAERQECDGSNLCWNRSELECKKDEISRSPDGAYGYYGPFMRCKNDETYQPQGPETHPRPPSVSSPRQTPGTVLFCLKSGKAERLRPFGSFSRYAW